MHLAPRPRLYPLKALDLQNATLLMPLIQVRWRIEITLAQGGDFSQIRPSTGET
jgi:hypothetical protein